MTVSTTLTRRRVDCVSDLTIDRYLLGEVADSRRVESHVRGCSSCSARLGALKGLYGTQLGAPTHERPQPMRRPPQLRPGEVGALQVLILRDGLLVGSELFTPGEYVVGSDESAELFLEGLEPSHARLFFRDGRAALQSSHGRTFVNGFPATSTELRPIDEVSLGAWTLRCRVIRERWSDPVPASPKVPERTLPERSLSERTVIERPVPSTPVPGPTRLTVSLWWGDSRQEARSFDGVVLASQFPLWGFTVPHGADFVLAERAADGHFVIHPPPRASASRADATLRVGELLTLREGAMRLVFSVEPVARLAPAPLPVHRPTFALSAVLMTSVVAGGVWAPERPEVPFAEHGPFFIHPVPLPQPQPPHPAPVLPSDDGHASAQPHPKPPRRPPSGGKKPSPGWFANISLPGPPPEIGHGHPGDRHPNPRPGFGDILKDLPGRGGPGLGIGADSGLGIGAGGLRGGEMGSGNAGRGAVGGLAGASRPVGRPVGPPQGSIDRDAVARVVASHLSEVQSCYESSLIANGHAAGRLALEWVVGTGGDVVQARVISATIPVQVSSCVIRHVKQWRFPLPRGGPVTVGYPFVFEASAF